MGVPADAGVAFAVFVTATSGHCTTMCVGRTASDAVLPGVEVARVLLRVQLVEVVGAVMCTVSLAPEARVDEVTEIGRASCRERVEIAEGGVAVTNDKVIGGAPWPAGRASVRTNTVAFP